MDRDRGRERNVIDGRRSDSSGCIAGRVRSRSRSAERRSSKRSRTSRSPVRDDRRGPEAPNSPRGNNAAAAGGGGGGPPQHASPAAAAAARVDVEVARRRFAGRLEGAEQLFGQLSAEAVTREWLFRWVGQLAVYRTMCMGVSDLSVRTVPL
jgi:hypothetical protein